MEHYFETLTKFFLQTLATLETNNNKRRDATLRPEVCIALGENNLSVDLRVIPCEWRVWCIKTDKHTYDD